MFKLKKSLLLLIIIFCNCINLFCETKRIWSENTSNGPSYFDIISTEGNCYVDDNDKKNIFVYVRDLNKYEIDFVSQSNSGSNYGGYTHLIKNESKNHYQIVYSWSSGGPNGEPGGQGENTLCYITVLEDKKAPTYKIYDANKINALSKEKDYLHLSNSPLIEFLLLPDKSSFLFDETKWYKDEVNLFILANDDKTATTIQNISAGNYAIINNSSSFYTIKNINGQQDFTFDVVDGVGNTKPGKISLKIDSTPPMINSCYTNTSSLFNINETDWVQYIFIGVNDVTDCTISYKRNGQSYSEKMSNNSFSFSNTGIYKDILINDSVGHSISIAEKRIDNCIPNIKLNELKFEKSNNKIDELICKLTATDDMYIISDYQSGINDNENKLTSNSKINDRNTLKILKLKASAKDKANNEAYYDWKNGNSISDGNSENCTKTINLPPCLQLQMYSTNSDENIIKNQIKIKYYNSDYWKHYKDMKLQRFMYLPDQTIEGEVNYIQITKENFSEYFTKELEKDFINFINPIEITEKDIDSNGNYTDIISEDNPFGHITTGYQLSWEITDLPGVREGSDELLFQPTANRQGDLELRIRGKNNTYKYISFNKDGTVIYINDNDNFEMPQNGCVYIAYRLKNQDIEPFDIEIREIVPIDENNIISVGIEGFKEYRINQYCKTIDSSGNRIDTFMVTDEIPYPCSNNFDENESWNEFDKPLYLYFNKPTQLMVYLNEGYLYGKGSNKYYGQEAFKSKAIILKAEPPKMDGEDCTLSVGENAGYNYDGITAKPFEPVDLRIESTNSNNKISPSNIIWDFGDGCNQNEPVVSVKHYWPQSELRKDDTSEYLMKITINDKENPINVHIVDTQYGEPYGDEVWRGNHKILNTITIPNTRTLKIGDENQYDATILCIGDNCEEYKAQIIVDSNAKLIIDNKDSKIEFIESYNSSNGYTKAKEMIYGWKGIYLKKGSIFKGQNFNILFADRAITLENDVYEFNLKNVVIDSGKIGLHIFDNNNLIINDCVISNNIVYGIKEDFINKNSMDEKLSIGYNITNLIFEGNTIDWYERNNGILTQEEINNKIQGE